MLGVIQPWTILMRIQDLTLVNVATYCGSYKDLGGVVLPANEAMDHHWLHHSESTN